MRIIRPEDFMEDPDYFDFGYAKRPKNSNDNKKPSDSRWLKTTAKRLRRELFEKAKSKALLLFDEDTFDINRRNDLFLLNTSIAELMNLEVLMVRSPSGRSLKFLPEKKRLGVKMRLTSKDSK